MKQSQMHACFLCACVHSLFTSHNSNIMPHLFSKQIRCSLAQLPFTIIHANKYSLLSSSHLISFNCIPSHLLICVRYCNCFFLFVFIFVYLFGNFVVVVIAVVYSVVLFIVQLYITRQLFTR